MNGLASLGLLSLAGTVFSVLLGHRAEAGAGLGGMIAPGMLGFVGLFLGAIFLVLTFAILRNAPRLSVPPPGLPS